MLNQRAFDHYLQIEMRTVGNDPRPVETLAIWVCGVAKHAERIPQHDGNTLFKALQKRPAILITPVEPVAWANGDHSRSCGAARSSGHTLRNARTLAAGGFMSTFADGSEGGCPSRKLRSAEHDRHRIGRLHDVAGWS